MKARKKRLIAPLTALVLTSALTLAGCGQTDAGSQSTSSGAASSTSSSIASQPDAIENMQVYRPETLAFGAPLAGFGEQGHLDGFADDVEIGTWSDAE